MMSKHQAWVTIQDWQAGQATKQELEQLLNAVEEDPSLLTEDQVQQLYDDLQNHLSTIIVAALLVLAMVGGKEEEKSRAVEALAMWLIMVHVLLFVAKLPFELVQDILRSISRMNKDIHSPKLNARYLLFRMNAMLATVKPLILNPFHKASEKYKVWNCRNAPESCFICKSMHGIKIPVEESFTPYLIKFGKDKKNIFGGGFAPPSASHPNCQCWLTYTDE